MRILIKIGSSLISKNHKLDLQFLKAKVKEISKLFHGNNEIILITSGAVASGMEIEKLNQRPKETLQLQMLSGEGQIVLMKHYYDFFREENITIAQVLLTHHNLDTESENKTIVKIIDTYLKQRKIPIINENDLINKEELENKNSGNNFYFTDNDILSAIVAKNLRVDLAMLLTDVDGLCDSDPKQNGNSKLIEQVSEIDERIKAMASKKTKDRKSVV